MVPLTGWKAGYLNNTEARQDVLGSLDRCWVAWTVLFLSLLAICLITDLYGPRLVRYTERECDMMLSQGMRVLLSCPSCITHRMNNKRALDLLQLGPKGSRKLNSLSTANSKTRTLRRSWALRRWPEHSAETQPAQDDSAAPTSRRSYTSPTFYTAHSAPSSPKAHQSAYPTRSRTTDADLRCC
jgi:hypothetical protein